MTPAGTCLKKYIIDNYNYNYDLDREDFGISRMMVPKK